MNFIRCGDISKFQFSILKALTLREFLVFRQLWLYTNPERNCSDRKTDEERLTLSPRLQLFVTFCSVEPLYCALRLPSEISPAQSPRSFDVSSLFTYRLDVRFLEVSRALFFDTGPPGIYRLGCAGKKIHQSPRSEERRANDINDMRADGGNQKGVKTSKLTNISWR